MSYLKRLFFGKPPRISYSQCGEDLAVCSIFEALGINRPSYIDIGAYDATYLSNTYLLYKMGSHGVCIEPNPQLYRKIKRKRTRDTCLNVGIGITSTKEAHFYCMSSPTLSTFSKEDAERIAGYGNERIVKTIAIPLVSFDEVVTRYLPACPNFISLDVEGLDFTILKSIDLTKYRPQVICVETLTYTEDKTERKITETIEYMLDNDYFVYADTFVNTVFVDKTAWATRRS